MPGTPLLYPAFSFKSNKLYFMNLIIARDFTDGLLRMRALGVVERAADWCFFVTCEVSLFAVVLRIRSVHCQCMLA